MTRLLRRSAGLVPALVMGIAAATTAAATLPPAGTIVTFAGGGDSADPSDPRPANHLNLPSPYSVKVDAAGNAYIADTRNNRIVRVDALGNVAIVAGTGTPGFSGDGGPAAAALLKLPVGLAVGRDGSLYLGDSGNYRIRKVTPDGIIHTIAGTGTAGYSSSTEPALNAEINGPTDLDVGPQGVLFVADTGNQQIRTVTPDGTISTVVQDQWPEGVQVGTRGDVYASDSRKNQVFRVDRQGNKVVVAGDGFHTDLTDGRYTGDGGPAVKASLDYPFGIALDAVGDVFIADSYNGRVREVTLDGIIRTVVGNGLTSSGGDGGLAIAAGTVPAGLAIDREGNLFIADPSHDRIREVFGIAAPGLLNGRPFPGSGDVDRNGAVDLSDAVLALRAVVGAGDLTAVQRAFGDVNGDGQLTLADVVLILRKAIGISTP